MNIEDKYGTPEYRRAVVDLYTRYLAWVDSGKPPHSHFFSGGGLCTLFLNDEETCVFAKIHVWHIKELYNWFTPFSARHTGSLRAGQFAREKHVREYLSHHAQEFDA